METPHLGLESDFIPTVLTQDKVVPNMGVTCRRFNAQIDSNVAKTAASEILQQPIPQSEEKRLVIVNKDANVIQNVIEAVTAALLESDRIEISNVFPVRFLQGGVRMRLQVNGMSRGLFCLSDNCRLPDGTAGEKAHGYGWNTDEDFDWPLEEDEVGLMFTYTEKADIAQ